jgi:DNA-binding response OmpR family regulator
MDKLIYFVEDDPLMKRMYERLFHLNNFALETASDGEEAIAKLPTLKQKPALILLDVMMPKLSGFEVLKYIKSDPNFKDIPVAMLTNLSSKEDEKKSLEMGAITYLIKSQYGPKEIVDKVKEVLGEGYKNS